MADPVLKASETGSLHQIAGRHKPNKSQSSGVYWGLSGGDENAWRCVVVDAVCRERVSAEVPVLQGKYREFFRVFRYSSPQISAQTQAYRAFRVLVAGEKVKWNRE
jgi:hypothetical protein